MAVLTLHAVLPHPIGVNATYRSGRDRWYKTPVARQWERDALLLLRAAGVRTLPPGAYWIACELTLHTTRLDIDAPLKLAIDTLAEALGVDDRWIGHVSITKYLGARSKQRLELVARVESLPDRAAFNGRSARHDTGRSQCCPARGSGRGGSVAMLHAPLCAALEV